MLVCCFLQRVEIRMAARSLTESIPGLLEGTRSSCFKPLFSHHTPPSKLPSPPLKSRLIWPGPQLQLRNYEPCTSTRSRVAARFFEPATFEASKLNVLFLGEGKNTRPDELPRAYTLTHCDITSKLTLAVAQTINKAQIQGWYSRLQRDEVLAEWRKSQGRMSLHVHCHISGGHWLLDVIAHLRFYIFRKELPVVLKAFRYGDVTLFENNPELEEALVWVYFHSNEKEFNRVECWGPLQEAIKGCASNEARKTINNAMDKSKEQRLMCSMESSTTTIMESLSTSSSNQGSTRNIWKLPAICSHPCKCCFPTLSVIPLPPSYQNSTNWQSTIEEHHR